MRIVDLENNSDTIVNSQVWFMTHPTSSKKLRLGPKFRRCATLQVLAGLESVCELPKLTELSNCITEQPVAMLFQKVYAEELVCYTFVAHRVRPNSHRGRRELV